MRRDGVATIMAAIMAAGFDGESVSRLSPSERSPSAEYTVAGGEPPPPINALPTHQINTQYSTVREAQLCPGAKVRRRRRNENNHRR